MEDESTLEDMPTPETSEAEKYYAERLRIISETKEEMPSQLKTVDTLCIWGSRVFYENTKVKPKCLGSTYLMDYLILAGYSHEQIIKLTLEEPAISEEDLLQKIADMTGKRLISMTGPGVPLAGSEGTHLDIVSKKYEPQQAEQLS